MPSSRTKTGNVRVPSACWRSAASSSITPLIPSARPGVVTSISRKARRFSCVAGTPAPGGRGRCRQSHFMASLAGSRASLGPHDQRRIPLWCQCPGESRYALWGAAHPRGSPSGGGMPVGAALSWRFTENEGTMPDKLVRLRRNDAAADTRRPVMLAIAGDSAAGKTTLTRGIAEALGPERATALCVDDYHRYDREERRHVPFTVLNPECNYIEVMEQHLQLLALGRPILKPVYDHSTGRLVRPVLVEPRDFVIVEGLLPLHTKLARACFDITVYLDPPEEIRR